MRYLSMLCIGCVAAGALISRLLWEAPAGGPASPVPVEQGLNAGEERPLAVARPAGARPVRRDIASELRHMERAGHERMAALDQRFRSEPVAARWSMETETAIRKAFTSEEAIRMGVAAPRSLSLECRSVTCRIEAVYDGAGDAADALQMLLMDISPQLPNAKHMSFEEPGGTSRIVLHATSAVSVPRSLNPASPAR